MGALYRLIIVRLAYRVLKMLSRLLTGDSELAIFLAVDNQ